MECGRSKNWRINFSKTWGSWKKVDLCVQSWHNLHSALREEYVAATVALSITNFLSSTKSQVGWLEGHSGTNTFSPHSTVEVGHNRTDVPWWLLVQDDLKGVEAHHLQFRKQDCFSFLILYAGNQQIRIKYTRLVQFYSKGQFQVCTILRAVLCRFYTLCFKHRVSQSIFTRSHGHDTQPEPQHPKNYELLQGSNIQ